MGDWAKHLMDRLRKKDPMPKEEPKRESGVAFNEQLQMVRIDLYFTPGSDSLVRALGFLAMAADVVKTQFSRWQSAKQASGILVPKSNGRGPLDVV